MVRAGAGDRGAWGVPAGAQPGAPLASHSAPQPGVPPASHSAPQPGVPPASHSAPQPGWPPASKRGLPPTAPLPPPRRSGRSARSSARDRAGPASRRSSWTAPAESRPACLSERLRRTFRPRSMFTSRWAAGPPADRPWGTAGKVSPAVDWRAHRQRPGKAAATARIAAATVQERHGKWPGNTCTDAAVPGCTAEPRRATEPGVGRWSPSEPIGRSTPPARVPRTRPARAAVAPGPAPIWAGAPPRLGDRRQRPFARTSRPAARGSH